jgi:uncharacterized OB-fold protein
MKQNMSIGDLKRHILTIDDGRRVLEEPRFYGVSQMVTSGEQSVWLIPLKEKAVIMGARCRVCGQVYAPAYLEYCGRPSCRFEPLEPVALPDTGILAAEPVVTLFAPARMHGEAPFAHGMVYLRNDRISTSTAMMFDMRTLKGVIRRGVYGKDTPVKLVFKIPESREGSITDCFCLPQSELTPAQIAKTPLLENELKWDEPQPPEYPYNNEYAKKLPGICGQIQTFFAVVNKSPRNQKRLKELDFNVLVVTGGGNFSIVVKDGRISMVNESVSSPSATMALENPGDLAVWTKGSALTNMFALGELWLSNRKGVRLLEDLDRLYRAALRDGVLNPSS